MDSFHCDVSQRVVNSLPLFCELTALVLIIVIVIIARVTSVSPAYSA